MPRCQNRERGRERRGERREESREQVKLTYNFMGIHSRFSSGLSTHQLIPLLSPRHAYIPRGIHAREKERERWEKETLNFTLTLKINCSQKKTTLVRNNCRNWRKKQRIRTSFSLRENLINSKDCNFVGFQICTARK